MAPRAVELAAEVELAAAPVSEVGHSSPGVGEVVAERVFMELFAGTANLTKAVVRLGLPAAPPLDEIIGHGSFDLACPAHFRELAKRVKARGVRWVHGAPPCKTFSRARRSDHLATYRTLRDEAHPLGIPLGGALPQRVAEANLLAEKMAELAFLQHRAGGWWSIENPLRSFMWMLPRLVDLAKLPGVSAFDGDQCIHGGFYRKPTRWLTNAPWLRLLVGVCPGPPAHVVHPTLQGKVVAPDGTTTWLTELAAEYPEGLCEAVARSYRDAPVEEEPPPHRLVTAAHGLLDQLAKPSRKQEREQDNNRAIGGLRSPGRAVAALPGAAAMGPQLADILDVDVLADPAMAEELVASLGSAELPGRLQEWAVRARERLASWLHRRLAPDTGIQAGLVEALARRAGDPDLIAASWLYGEAPLGITMPIVPAGVFPLIEEDGEEECLRSGFGPSVDNYTSFAEHASAADELLREEVANGWLLWRSSRRELEALVGQVVLSPMGAIAKQKNGSLKIRIVHDLRRSGVNARVSVPERLVLPRLSDVIEDVLAVIGRLSPEEDWEPFVLDFQHAFKQVQVHPAESKYLAGSGLGGFFASRRILFGIKSGPLVWGRVAALIMRITATTLMQENARLQCYVDDPLTVIGGTRVYRIRVMLRIVVLWLALGLRVSWKKGASGDGLEWIGAALSHWTAHGGTRGLMVSLTPARCAQLAEVTAVLQSQARPSKVDLRRLAGLAGWVAGLLPQLAAFVQMLWAALTAQPNASTVAAAQVRLPLQWLNFFAAASLEPVVRRCRAAPAYCTVLSFDGSPTGGGATLQPGAPDVRGEVRSPFVAYCVFEWTAADELLVHATRGDCGSQALWEAYTLLLAVAAWRPLLAKSQGTLVFRGDALGVLFDAVRFRAKSPALNRVCAELALLLAPMGLDLAAVHFWSELNSVCDALSRVTEGARLPDVLSGVARTGRADRQFPVLASAAPAAHP